MGAGAVAVAGVAASVIGTGVSVYGAMQQSAAAQKAAAYQAKVADNNAIVANQNAQAVQNQATQKALADQRAGAIRLGAQRASMGASGVTLDSGSALDLQGATASNTALGVANDQYQGQLAAYGYENQATNFTSQAGVSTMQGQAAESAGFTNAASSFLSGASQVSSKWDAYRNTVTSPKSTATDAPVFGGLY